MMCFPPTRASRCASTLLAVIGAALLSQAGYAQQAPGGAYVPGYGKTFPLYFSGTNCRAFGEVYIYSDPIPPNPKRNLTEATLYVGGEQVAGWQNPIQNPTPRQPACLRISLSAIFDSTHFPSQTQIRVRITGKDNLGGIYDSDITQGIKQAKAKNAVLLAEETRMYSPPGVPYAGLTQAQTTGPAFFASTYSTKILDTTPWDANAYFNAFKQPDINVDSLVAHGLPDNHNTNFETSEVYAQDYMANQIANIGTSALPPFNTSTVPPLNFLHVLTCQSGSPSINDPDGNQYGSALWPHFNHYSPIPNENQAALTYAVFLFIPHLPLYSKAIADEMMAGKTADKARDWVFRNLTLFCSDTGGGAATLRAATVDDTRLWGDFHTRIRTVYTGDSSAPTGAWYIANPAS